MFIIVKDIIKKLTLQYFYNCPEQLLENEYHLLFQLQKCYWDYLDIFCLEYKKVNIKLPYYSEKEFMKLMIDCNIFLFLRIPNFEEMYKKWLHYINKIPVYGSILIDPTLKWCLMVKCYRDYCFPKGKINENESSVDCAIRETYEETGYDISQKIDKNEYLEWNCKSKIKGFYIIYDVNMNTRFYPQNQGEILDYKWFPIHNLPLGSNWDLLKYKLIEKVTKKELYLEYGISVKQNSKQLNNKSKLEKNFNTAFITKTYSQLHQNTILFCL